MSPVTNRFTKLFNLSTPLVSAPMAYATSPALVAAVINAGGLGFLGAGNEPAPKLAEALDEAAALVDADKRHLIGMGFVGWVLDMFNKDTDPRLNTVLAKKPLAIWLAYGEDLGKYVRLIREHDAAQGRKTYLFVNVNSKDEALRAANEWKVDAIIAQGGEAGGRGGAFSPPLKAFVSEVVAALPNGPLILGAGGITTGAQAAEIIALGADAVVLGTRLLFTPECAFSDSMKDTLVAAGPNSTVRSQAFDIVFPPNVWPKGIEAQCVKNAIVTDYDEGLPPQERKAHISSGSPDYAVIYAGPGIADVNEIQPAAEVIKLVSKELAAALKV